MKNTKDQAQATGNDNQVTVNNEAKVKKSKKVKSEKKEKKAKETKEVKALKKQVKTNLLEEVVTKREVKYLYPEDCQDTLSRKKHRQAVRNQLHKLELEMHRIEDKNSKAFKAKQKEYEEFKRANVKKGVAA